MIVYYALIILLILSSILFHGEHRGNYKYIYFAVLLMFCVYGLRDAYLIGNDSTTSYIASFEQMENTEWADLPTFADWLQLDENTDENGNGHGRNIANTWLMKLIYVCTDGDYQTYIVIVSAFVMLVFAHTVLRYSVSPIQSILYYFGLMFFTFNISAIKQSIAMAFIMLAFDAITDRKFIRFIIFVAVGSMFHFPALVFLPAYWISSMRFGKSYIVLLAMLFIVTYLMRDNLVDWMTDTYDTVINDNSTTRFLANKVLVMLIIIALALITRPPSADDRVYCSLLMFAGVAAVIQTFSSYNNTFERLADYYFQFDILFIPMIFENMTTSRSYINSKQLYLVRKAGPYLFCIFSIWRFLHYVSGQEFLNNYHFCF